LIIVFTIFFAGFVICLMSTVYVYYEFNSLSGSGSEADSMLAFTRNLISRERTTTATKTPSTTTTSGRSLRGGAAAVQTGVAAATTVTIATATEAVALVNKEQASVPPTASAADDGGLYATCYHGTIAPGPQQHAHIVNDDYCDCASGADEPLTSACSSALVAQGVFDCGNGQALLFASRVGDGVCDCTNGRDEAAIGACAVLPVAKGAAGVHRSPHLGW
jgi:hypothetical protein